MVRLAGERLCGPPSSTPTVSAIGATGIDPPQSPHNHVFTALHIFTGACTRQRAHFCNVSRGTLNHTRMRMGNGMGTSA